MTEGRCPSCGAAIAFTAGSAQVLVCPHCQTVVARRGAALERRGKVAALVATQTPLRLGATGTLERRGFRLVGHLQKDHGRGPWDEWYLEFDDGRGGWLAEAEGALYLTFLLSEPPAVYLEHVTPGATFAVGKRVFTVEEIGESRLVAAEGELPEGVPPPVGRYLDATADDGSFATIDFGDRSGPADFYVGRAVTFAELGLEDLGGERRPKRVDLQQARCPQCNGPLELRAPDRTKRVACPYCAALIDVSAGKLAFLQALEKPDHEPWVPLGTTGTLQGTAWVCIGFFVRSCKVEGVRYPWDEYLLYSQGKGFAWLMCANGHWTLLTPIAAGSVKVSGKQARHQGAPYRWFQTVTARTDYVLGECYWEVEAGETSSAIEYVAPPRSLNKEQTENEVTWTLGEYLPAADVKRAFLLKKLPRTTGIAPSQPNPHKRRVRGRARWAVIYSAVLLLLAVVANIAAAKQLLVEATVEIPVSAESGAPAAMHFSQPFEIPRKANLAFGSYSSLSNDWLGLQVDLVNEQTGEVTAFYSELSYYFGRDSDGSWSEGSQTDTEYISAIPPGRYLMRLTPVFQAGPPTPRSYGYKLTSDVPRTLWLVLGLLLLWVPVLISTMRIAGFESKRWEESSG